MSPKEIGSIIIGKSWLFDQNDTLQDQPNTYIFRSQDNKISVDPSPPRVYMPENESLCFTYSETLNATKTDHLSFDEIVRLYILMFDKLDQFHSYFRKTLWHLLGRKMIFSSTYHKSLGRILCGLIGRLAYRH